MFLCLRRSGQGCRHRLTIAAPPGQARPAGAAPSPVARAKVCDIEALKQGTRGFEITLILKASSSDCCDGGFSWHNGQPFNQH